MMVCVYKKPLTVENGKNGKKAIEENKVAGKVLGIVDLVIKGRRNSFDLT
jgi:hypothetical protein